MEPTDDASDAALMAAYAGGDARAFETLFARHRGPLFTFLLHRTGSRSAAEDLFQDVFLRLIRRRREFRPTGSFRSWLFTIAHNATTDLRRRGALREPTEDAMIGETEPAGRDGLPEPVGAAHVRDVRARIEAALLEIPSEQRDVFLMRERGGLEYAQIAEVTGAALATVKSRMRYALANLRRRLAGELPSLSGGTHD